jgi:hypothetical protein
MICCLDCSELKNWSWSEMKIPDIEGNIVNLQIGHHKYFLNGTTWNCTIRPCYGSIQVIDGRYSDMNGHKCNAETKQQKLNETAERRLNKV